MLTISTADFLGLPDDEPEREYQGDIFNQPGSGDAAPVVEYIDRRRAQVTA